VADHQDQEVDACSGHLVHAGVAVVVVGEDVPEEDELVAMGQDLGHGGRQE
jgi:hypothetical protein